MKKNKIDVLIESAKNKRKQTINRVNMVIKIMHENSLPINFASVAKLVHVSKTWLYNEPDIFTEISNARKKGNFIQRSIDFQSAIKRKDREIDKLKIKNNLYLAQITQLQKKLEIVHGELYRLKNQYSLKLIKPK